MSDTSSQPGPIHYLKRYEWFIIGLAVSFELLILSAITRADIQGPATLLLYLVPFLLAIFVPIGLLYRATLRRADDMQGYQPE